MKREVQLYIQDTRVDLFTDETISVTDSIQNVSDISKVFTPFSKQFNLPASATNNKLFKHYYNFDIQGGFDARFRVDARIEINHVPFKVGQIRLDGVSMKNNLPHTYKVVFFGKPSDLKDIFGDEELNSLNSLSTYDIKSDTVTGDVEDAFKTGLQISETVATSDDNRNIIVPLISVENYYTYDSGTHRLDTVTWANLRKDLKPAIKLKRIIEAIETQYSITFNMADETEDIVLAENSDTVITEGGDTVILEDAAIGRRTFFGSAMFDQLYLWLHREKTPYTALDQATKYFGINYTSLGVKRTLSDYTYIGPSGGDVVSGGKITINEGESYSLRFRFIANAANVPIEIISRDKTTNELFGVQERLSSTSAMVVSFIGLTSGNLSSRVFEPEVRFNNNTNQNLTFSAQSDFAASEFGLEINKTVNGVTTQHIYGNSSFQLAYMIFIQDYLPKMKIIDFLTGLFKMFNLVAFTKRSSNTIYVQTFDDFMVDGVTRDITKYVDITQGTIDRPVPYNQVNFKYSAPVTQTSLRYINNYSQIFGDLRYSAPEKYDGQAFNLELPFERSVLVNLVNSSGTATNNVEGWWADADGKTTLGKPFIFFNRVTDSSSNTITSSNFTTYNAPSNVSALETAGVGNHTLNFGSEYDELKADINQNSLFSRFYEQYVVQTYNQNGRIIKITANLPVSFVLNYNVNDVILINDQEYYINTIQTDLTTGKSQLELIVKKVAYTNSVLS